MGIIDNASGGAKTVRARILLEVVAGVLPGTPMPELTKQWAISSDQWYAQGEYEGKEEEAAAKCREIQEKAIEYQKSLMDPRSVNWVRFDWIYL